MPFRKKSSSFPEKIHLFSYFPEKQQKIRNGKKEVQQFFPGQDSALQDFFSGKNRITNKTALKTLPLFSGFFKKDS